MTIKELQDRPKLYQVTVPIAEGSTISAAVPLIENAGLGTSSGRRVNNLFVLTHVNPVTGLQGGRLTVQSSIDGISFSTLLVDEVPFGISGGESIDPRNTFGKVYIRFVASEAQSAERNVVCLVTEF